MLDSAPIPLQAILWPFLGAIILLIAGRLLPNWLRRFVALLAAGGSLYVLWPLRTMDAGQVEFFWEPLNLFRTSPTLQSDGLMVLAGLSMGVMTAACVLGIAGAKPQSTPFHGLALLALAGGMIVTMGVNLVTLALGSALIDLTLIAMAVSVEQDGRVSWRTVLPGLLSTLLLFGAALRMNTQVGSASLQAKVLPDEVAVVLGLAGLLRLIVLALPPRAARTPEHAALLILPTAVGLYLLARIQLLAPIHVDQPWMVAVGSVLLAIGGFLSWTALVPKKRRWQASGGQERSEADPTTVRSGGDKDALGSRMLAADAATESYAETESRVEPQPSLPAGPEDARVYKGGEMSRGTWPGLAAHQVGLALCFVLLLGGAVPWPLLSLPFTLGILVIWWDASLERQHGPRPGWVSWIVRRLSRIEDRQDAHSEADDAAVPRPFAWAWIRVVSIVPAIVALAALVGVPFTIGARVRWMSYAALLDLGKAPLLFAAIAGDLFLIAALWIYMQTTVRRLADFRLRPLALVGMLVLAFLVVALGISTGVATEGWGFQPSYTPIVSAWGLGLIYVLPWLLGVWLARSGSGLGRYLYPVGRALRLDWLGTGVGWVAKRVIDAFFWLGRVGEGEGWWGWAIIVLALGAIFLTTR